MEEIEGGRNRVCVSVRERERGERKKRGERASQREREGAREREERERERESEKERERERWREELSRVVLLPAEAPALSQWQLREGKCEGRRPGDCTTLHVCHPSLSVL